MNLFIFHPQNQGITYREHYLFAMGIAIRLSKSVFAFTLHALFPFIDIKRTLDLEETANYILERNNWIETEKLNKQTKTGQMPFDYETEGVFSSNI